MSDESIKDLVKQKYGQAALRVTAIGSTSCCGASSNSSCDPVTSNLYAQDQTAELPETAVAASLGCGNPTALAELNVGETVLDLGSGGGIDVVLSAKRVGSSGKAYGLVMTYEMLALARQNQRKAGFDGVEIESTRIYRTEDAREFLDREGIDAEAIAPSVDGKFMSAFVRARKPSTV